MGLAGGPAGLGRDFGFAMCKMEPWKTLFSVPFLSFLHLVLRHNNFLVLKVHPTSKRKKSVSPL